MTAATTTEAGVKDSLSTAALRDWPDGYQPIIDVASAYQDMPTDLQAVLGQSFRGGLTMRQTVELADRMVQRLTPDVLGLVLARLIVVAEERPAHGGFL